MVTRDTAWPTGVPCWVDLGVDDADKARAFYGGLFGWDVQPGPPEAGGYTMCLKDGRAVAGLGPKQAPPEVPPTWTTYIAVDDADIAAKAITNAGGNVVMPPMDVMDVGRMAIAVDTGGATFAIWQARAHIGAGLVNEPGSLSWNENMSRDFEGNKAFYHAVFGYAYGDLSAGDFKYATLDLNGNTVGGIGELPADAPADMPAAWSIYFTVADADAAVAKVIELGGSVLRPPADTPYGRMATVTDDQGAVFSVMASPAS